jgi:hypothetical protein
MLPAIYEKYCSRCKSTKDIKEFNKNSKYCRKCNSAYLKEHYNNNKNYYKDKQKKYRTELRLWMNSYKDTLSCKECGEDHPACIEFHHRDPTKKEINVSEVVNQLWSVGRILKEIEKCDILCSNCHRKLHYEEV